MSVMLVVVERMEECGRRRLVELVGPSLVPGFVVALDERGRQVEIAIDTVHGRYETGAKRGTRAEDVTTEPTERRGE